MNRVSVYIVTPILHAQRIWLVVSQSLYDRAGELQVRDERYPRFGRPAANEESVWPARLIEFPGNIDHKIDFAIAHEVHGVVLLARFLADFGF